MISSPVRPSDWSCYAEDTTCAWRLHPTSLGFVESAGLPAVAYGPDSQAQLEEEFFRNFWKIQNPIGVLRRGREYLSQGWSDMSTTLTSMAEGADLGIERPDLPGAGRRCRGVITDPFCRTALDAAAGQRPRHSDSAAAVDPFRDCDIWWLHWRMTKEAEDDQRRGLALPKPQPPPRGESRSADHSRSRPTTRSTSPAL